MSNSCAPRVSAVHTHSPEWAQPRPERGCAGPARHARRHHLVHPVSENRDLAGEALQGLVCETFRRLFNLTAQTCLEWDSHCHVYFS
jgi:hypothetical protein